VLAIRIEREIKSANGNVRAYGMVGLCKTAVRTSISNAESWHLAVAGMHNC